MIVSYPGCVPTVVLKCIITGRCITHIYSKHSEHDDHNFIFESMKVTFLQYHSPSIKHQEKSFLSETAPKALNRIGVLGTGGLVQV